MYLIKVVTIELIDMRGRWDDSDAHGVIVTVEVIRTCVSVHVCECVRVCLCD